MDTLVNTLATLLARGHADKARALVDSYKTRTPALFHIGRAALAVHDRDPQVCLEHAQLASQLEPEEPLPFHYMVAAFMMLDDQENAELSARQAVALGATSKSQVALASILCGRRKFAEAADLFQAVLAREPENLEALRGQALAVYRQRDYPAALGALAKIFDVDPGDATPITNVIDVLTDMGRLLGALAAAQLLRQKQPSPELAVVLDLATVQLMRLLGDAFPERHAVVDADETVGTLMRSAAARSPQVRLSVANSLIDIGRHEEARSMLVQLERKALSAKETGLLFYLKGILAQKQEQFAAALPAFVEAIERDPEQVDSCTNAVAYLLEDGSAPALAEVQRLFTLVSVDKKERSPHLLFNEGIYLRTIENTEGAKRQLQLALRISPSDSEVARLCQRALDEIA